MKSAGVMTNDELKAVLDLHGKWLRNEEDGQCADLRGANLHGAYLRYANLSAADLRGADLSRANLRGANLNNACLSGANLYGANLYGADLSVADLCYADLSGANLHGANLNNANLPNGVKWETYVAELVPQLLTIRGRTLDDMRKSFTCHTWENCPMAEAFGVHSLDDIPALYKAEAALFVTLFDGNALTGEVVFGPGLDELKGVKPENWIPRRPELLPTFPPPQGRCEYCGCLMRDHHDFIARAFGDKEYCAIKTDDEILYERTGGTDGGY